jgi:multiple sugar transport system permease protein
MGFLKTLPKEVEESAMVDGCSRLGAVGRVVLPLAVWRWSGATSTTGAL